MDMPPSDPKTFPPLPKRIGKYKIDGLYAQGGMSIIYLAQDPDRQEQALIKVLQPNLLADSESVAHFLNEAHIISKAKHPNIVQLYEYGEWENGLFIAMEFIKGQSLRQVLQHNPFPLRRAIDVLLQISYALWHLHSLGIIHGDLKLENILLTDEGQVKVIDFGISRILSETTTIDEASTKSFKGTPIYMSPELHKNQKAYSFQSDIYSLGIIAYELILGKITHGKIIISLAPRGMQKIVTKALQPNPKDRYQSVSDMIHDLSEYTHSGEISKDKQGVDYFFELFEKVEYEQKALMKSLIPPSHHLWEAGIATSFGIGVKGLYYQIIFDNDSCLICACATASSGINGVLDVIKIDTIWKTYFHNCPPFLSHFEQGLAFLKEIQRHNILLAESTLCTFSTSSMKYRWMSSKWSSLFFINNKDPKNALIRMIQPHETQLYQELLIPPMYEQEGTVFENEELFLSCCMTSKILEFPSSPNLPFDMMMSQLLKNIIFISPQKKADSVLQTLRLQGDCMIEDHPALFFSLKEMPLRKKQ